MSVRKLKADEKANTSVRVNDRKVSVTFGCGDYLLSTTLDFANVSHEDLMTLACKSVVIAVQRQWHALHVSNQKDATAATAFNEIDVQKDVLNATKGKAKKTDSAKAVSILDKLTEEERKNLLAKYAAA
ncbi:hypothetical protein ACU4I5_05690 [Ensifer adhaerens]